MRALSLWQPHAIAIGLGLKRYETRGWSLPDYAMGIPVAIHASKKRFREQDYEREWFKEARDRLSKAGVPLWRLDYGKVVCIVEFTQCAPAQTIHGEFWGDFREFGDDGKQRYAFKMNLLRLIPEAQRPEITGRQGFFDVPNELGLWVQS